MKLPVYCLLLAIYLVPACAPDRPTERSRAGGKILLLSDSTRWRKGGKLRLLMNAWRENDLRVITSGTPEESPASLGQRLPWLLQPGVDTLYYDTRLAGPAGADSIRLQLERLGHPASLFIIADKDMEPAQ